LRDALQEKGWKPPLKNELDACVEWTVIDFEYGVNAADSSLDGNITSEQSGKHFGDQELLITDKRGFD